MNHLELLELLGRLLLRIFSAPADVLLPHQPAATSNNNPAAVSADATTAFKVTQVVITVSKASWGGGGAGRGGAVF